MMRLKVAKDDRESRMNFVSYWANFVRTHSDEEWGNQQKILIDSMIQSSKANKMSREHYLEMKKAVHRT